LWRRRKALFVHVQDGEATGVDLEGQQDGLAGEGVGEDGPDHAAVGHQEKVSQG